MNNNEYGIRAAALVADLLTHECRLSISNSQFIMDRLADGFEGESKAYLIDLINELEILLGLAETEPVRIEEEYNDGND